MAAQRIWQGHQDGRSITTSPQPQQGNAPPQGLLAAWHSPCPGSTPIPNSMHCCTSSGSSSSSALPSPAGRELPLLCSCLPLPAAALGSPRASWSRQVEVPGPASCPAELRACDATSCHGLPVGRQEMEWAKAGTHHPAATHSRQEQPLPWKAHPQGAQDPRWRRTHIAEQRLAQLAAAERSSIPTPPTSQPGLGCKHCVQPPGLCCRNLAAYTTPVPWYVIEGLKLLLLQKTGTLPPPVCHPLTTGPSWSTETVTLVQGNLCYLTMGSTKPGQR